MDQQLRALATLDEDSSQIPTTRMVAHSLSVTLILEALPTSFGLSEHQTGIQAKQAQRR